MTNYDARKSCHSNKNQTFNKRLMKFVHFYFSHLVMKNVDAIAPRYIVANINRKFNSDFINYSPYSLAKNSYKKAYNIKQMENI